MKDFPKAKFKSEYRNDFGETMKMVVDSDDKIWIHHDDCNADYEELKNFKYILNDSEITVLGGFIEIARAIYRLDNIGNDFYKFHLAIAREIASIVSN
jgi:hypothetical protein